jgi:molybdate transport system substrate-binding protein
MSQLKILSAGAVKRGVSQLAEAYAREQGKAVDVQFATAPEVRRRVESGEGADLVVAPINVMEAFAKAGRVVSESRKLVGRSRMGVTVHARSAIDAVPDVATLKRLLEQASEVVHNKASSGIYAAKLLEQLGLASALAGRIVVVDSGAGVMEYVAAHPSAIGLAQISEIRVLVEKGLPVRLAAPLPDEVQNVTGYEAAAIARGPQEAAACDLARFMTTPQAKAVFAASGID